MTMTRTTVTSREVMNGNEFMHDLNLLTLVYPCHLLLFIALCQVKYFSEEEYILKIWMRLISLYGRPIGTFKVIIQFTPISATLQDR